MEKVTNWKLRARVEYNGLVGTGFEFIDANDPRQPIFLPEGRGQVTLEIQEVFVEDTDSNEVLDLKRELLQLNELVRNQKMRNESLHADRNKLSEELSEAILRFERMETKCEELETTLRVMLNLLRNTDSDGPVKGVIQ